MMRVVILKDTKGYDAGFEGFIPRILGRTLCQQNIAIPWSVRKKNADYKAIKKQLKKKKKAERAISTKAVKRETATTGAENLNNGSNPGKGKELK